MRRKVPYFTFNLKMASKGLLKITLFGSIVEKKHEKEDFSYYKTHSLQYGIRSQTLGHHETCFKFSNSQLKYIDYFYAQNYGVW